MSAAVNILEEHCNNYVKYRRAGGIGYLKGERILKRFLRHCEAFVFESNTLPKAAVIAWNTRDANESGSNQQIRVNTVRAFAEYLTTKGVNAYISEPFRIKATNFVPYVFTNDELARFFLSSDNCMENLISKHRHLIMPVIFRLLYSCGLRVSEALNLRICDVDLDHGILTVLDTKFHKDRLIPVNTELLSRLRNYANLVLAFSEPENPFFPSPSGGFYAPGTLYYAFRDILWRAGISHGGKGKGPRIHDFRHTFAVHCLKRWVLSRKDLSVALPYLSAYMGHDGIRHTQVYLRLTADLYPDIVSKMEEHFDVLPELGGAYEAY